MNEAKTRDELLEELEALRNRLREMELEPGRSGASATSGELVETCSDMFAGFPCGLMVCQYQPPNELFLLNANIEAERLTDLIFDEIRGQEFDEIWPNARGSGLTGALLRTMETGELFDTDNAVFRNGKVERRFRMKAFRMPVDRLGIAIEPPPDRTADKLSESDHAAPSPSRGLCGRSVAAEDLLFRCEPLVALGEIASGAVLQLDDLIQGVLENSWTGSSCVESGHYRDLAQYLKEIRDNALEASKIIELVHQLARARPTEGESERYVFDLNDAVVSGVQLSELWWESNPKNMGIDISVQMELSKGCRISGDQGAVVEMVVALLKNAIEAYPEGGVITVKTAVTPRGHAVLRVRDRGVGIPHDEIKDIFEPFRSGKGPEHRGMGLTRARTLAQTCDGEITVDSEEGKGCSVEVRFPLASEAAPLSFEESTLSLDLKLSILLVVNTKSIVKMLDAGLSKHGQTVITARSFDEAFEAFKESAVDVVICDMGIPGDALDLAGRIRAECERKKVGKALFILLTGWGQDVDDMERLRRTGVDTVFPKPVDVPKLVDTIRSHLLGA